MFSLRLNINIKDAAAYIQQKGMRYGVGQYIEAFQKNEKRKTILINSEAGHLRRDLEAKNSIIIITWQILFDDFQEKWPLSADLLSLMSYFDRQGIPQDVLIAQCSSWGSSTYQAQSPAQDLEPRNPLSSATIPSTAMNTYSESKQFLACITCGSVVMRTQVRTRKKKKSTDDYYIAVSAPPRKDMLAYSPTRLKLATSLQSYVVASYQYYCDEAGHPVGL